MTNLLTEFSDIGNFVQTCWQYLFLGIIQGITEFLPISSTAHLKAVPMMLGWGDPGVAITAVLQLGSIVAVITYFKKDLKNIINGISFAFQRGQWREPEARLGIAIITGSLPILLTGMIIKLYWNDFDKSPLRSIPAIGVTSIVMAVLLGAAELCTKKNKSILNISGADGLWVGISQVLALLPGASRSGVTLTASMLTGWKRQDAARFSFLLGIPAISFSGLAQLKDALHNHWQLSNGLLPLLIGIFSSAVVSWFAIDWLIKYLEKRNTWIFIIYRLLFGITLLGWSTEIQANFF